METKEALERISYMDELISQGRGNLSRAWWVLFVWGIFFCLVGLWSLSLVDRPPLQGGLSYLGFLTGYVLTFSAFIGLPILFSILLARPSTELTNRLLLLNVLLVAVFVAVSLFSMNQTSVVPFASARLRFDWDFLPIMAAGTLLIATGIFLSKSLAKVGLLLVVFGAFTTVPSLQSTWTGNVPGPVTRGSIPGLLYLASGLTLMIYAIWVRSHRDS